jgi:acyl-ACP thioesterase
MEASDFIGKYEYDIRSYHTDASGRLFLHHLFNLLQDVAHNHANGLGFGMPQLLEKDMFWVLSRITVHVVELPKHEDRVEISTWVKSIHGVKSEREFSIRCNSKEIITASSLWFCLTATTHRPAPIPEAFKGLMIVNDIYAVPNGATKVNSVLENHEVSKGIKVTAFNSDIDMVDHVNNATYVRWIMDEARINYPTNSIKEFTINYLSEVFLGQEITINHCQSAPNQVTTSVIREADNKTICRAVIEWY